MHTPSQSRFSFRSPASWLRGRTMEDLIYPAATLGAIVLVLTSILLF